MCPVRAHVPYRRTRSLRPSRSVRLGVGLAAVLCAVSLAWARQDPDKLPPTRVQDLHYGDVLFYFYQGDDFEAITRLNAYDHWGLMPHHSAESQLLLGGLYLSLGLHNEAGVRFEKLLTPDVPVGVRNRAWFYLAQVWYSRGYLDRTEQALRQVQGKLPAQLEAQRTHLLANVLLRQGRFDEAVQLLRDWRGAPDWVAYARFNLGVALVREGKVDEADAILGSVGALDSAQPEMLALRDRANLALGFAYLQANKPDKALPILERVRLNGPYSNKALLGVGWADAALGDYRGALVPWLALRGRNLLDAAVQESYLAVPYAYGKLNANAQAADNYEDALRSFAAEGQNLEDSVQRIRDGKMLDALLTGDEDTHYGWFWQLRTLPAAPESRYLYPLLADHDFQEGLKNYRDLGYMGHTLERWSESMVAFSDMIDTREHAYAERLPRVDTLLSSGAADNMQHERDSIETRLNSIERENDVAALGAPDERAQWVRIRELETALATAPNDEATNALRDRLRLVKGVLYFRLNDAFKARVWQERRTIKDLDLALREAQNRWVRVERARSSVTVNTGEFAARLAALKARIDALQIRLAGMEQKQNEHLQQLAVAELAAQKDRLATYEVQARFALASMYDRAANAPKPAAPSTQPPQEQPGAPADASSPGQPTPPAANPDHKP
jgi:TolA-binding protein